jgi:alkanesulfonate monooxygenase
LPDLPISELVVLTTTYYRFSQTKIINFKDNYRNRSASQVEGHWVVIGMDKYRIAQLEEWFLKNAADGFNILSRCYPRKRGSSSLSSTVDPELQKRGRTIENAIST